MWFKPKIQPILPPKPIISNNVIRKKSVRAILPRDQLLYFSEKLPSLDQKGMFFMLYLGGLRVTEMLGIDLNNISVVRANIPLLYRERFLECLVGDEIILRDVPNRKNRKEKFKDISIYIYDGLEAKMGTILFQYLRARQIECRGMKEQPFIPGIYSKMVMRNGKEYEEYFKKGFTSPYRQLVYKRLFRRRGRDVLMRVKHPVLRMSKAITIHLHPHYLRHARATHLVEKYPEINPLHLKKLFGWSSLEMATIYTHSNPQQIMNYLKEASK